MRKKFALLLLASLVLVAIPALSTPVVATDLTVDEFLFEGLVTTEAVAAVRCPIPSLGCNHVNADCGIYAGVCHCKAGGVGGQILVCVANP